MNEEVRGVIEEMFLSELGDRDRGGMNRVPDELVLLDSGLDSIGFATLVAKLEEKLGYDPFVQMDEPVYPRTFGEFVEIYEEHADGQS
ncbi:phosphopantetheine-binding protein [Salinibacter pepae]|jgi:acyl carrier protein|uniref:phosphopantetheine-binding protein n=1 Tax=Salinibacter pepae TaxID=3040382 RepID=UPI0021E744CF|nr:phosphopantetheine-binding protein [Salinibacter pepae]